MKKNITLENILGKFNNMSSEETCTYLINNGAVCVFKNPCEKGEIVFCEIDRNKITMSVIFESTYNNEQTFKINLKYDLFEIQEGAA